MFYLGIVIGAALTFIILNITMKVIKKIKKKAVKREGILDRIRNNETRSLINRYNIHHPPEFKVFDMVKHREKANNCFKVMDMRTSIFCRYLTLYDSKNDITFTDKERLYEKTEEEQENER